jgi:hypothetical protein
LDKLERNKHIKHKHDKKLYMIERFVINVLCKEIISYLWVHVGARLHVLWKGNIAFLWAQENNFILMIMGDSDFS